MSNPKRMHPAGIIFQILVSLKNLIYGLLPITIIIISDGYFLYAAIGIAVIGLLLVGYSILYWFRFTYAIVDDELRIEKGLLIRKKRYISKNRIQSIDLTQGIIHRILGLTKVQIETAGSDSDVDASLSAVTFVEGELIRDTLKSNRKIDTNTTDFELTDEVKEEKAEKDEPTYEVSFKRLIIAGSTSGRLGVILGLAVAFFSEIENLIPDRIYDQAFEWVVALTVQIIIALAILVLLVLWMLGTLGTVIKYGNFKITRFEKELFITRGLLEKKQMTIPLKRIQAVGMKQSLVRQPLGFATIYVEIAGGETKEGTDMETLLVPIIHKKEVDAFFEKMLPELKKIPTELTPLPKRALPYYLLRVAFLPLIALIVVGFVWPEWMFIPAIISLIALLFGYACYKTTGFSFAEDQLTICTRNFSKDTLIAKRSRIQAMTKKRHFIHRKQKLATLRLSILNNFMGRHVIVSEMNESDADEVAEWYGRR